MTKTRITRTYGPIHFEDLDPHRFEDLIRELIYDHKDWQTIEATGRSGNDAGFDIRAYEKAESVYPTEKDEDGEIEEKHPMEGNLWMIQGKREKEIGPKRVKSILEAVDSKNPPYGYILAASANFSKESYDVFRNTLQKKGVMEFYLWGKAEIEDMLHLPKNDRVLFTFFGVSLVDFQGAQGPFDGYRTHIKQGQNIFDLENFRRIGIFPKSFPAPQIGRVHTARKVTLDDWSLRVFKLSNDRLVALFDCDGKYSFLKVRDVISIAGTDEGSGSSSYIQITHKESIKAKDHLRYGENVEWNIERQIGRKPDPDEIVNIYEFRRTYEWKFSPKQSS